MVDMVGLFSGRGKFAEADPEIPEARPREQDEREQRQTGGHAHALRNSALMPSARSTSRKNTSRNVDTSPPFSMRIDSSIWVPRPPAPTKPITTDARNAPSQR